MVPSSEDSIELAYLHDYRLLQRDHRSRELPFVVRSPVWCYCQESKKGTARQSRPPHILRLFYASRGLQGYYGAVVEASTTPVCIVQVELRRGVLLSAPMRHATRKASGFPTHMLHICFSLAPGCNGVFLGRFFILLVRTRYR